MLVLPRAPRLSVHVRRRPEDDDSRRVVLHGLQRRPESISQLARHHPASQPCSSQWYVQGPTDSAEWARLEMEAHPAVVDDTAPETLGIGSTRADDSIYEDVFPEGVTLPLRVLTHVPRAVPLLAWHPAWAHLEDATRWDGHRLAVVAALLTAQRTATLTLRLPPSVRHVQRWLDLLWALQPCLVHTSPSLVWLIQGSVTPATHDALLALFRTDESTQHLLALPVRSPAWPRWYAVCTERWHLAFQPLADETETLRALGFDDVGLARTCLASYSVLA